MRYCFGYEFRLAGKLFIAEEDGFITAVSKTADNSCVLRETSLIRETKRQLEEYFGKTRTHFTLPLKPEGTDFQKKIWAELEKIPYGQTISYGELAKRAGNPRGARAAGSACNKNPVCIIIPCHRVVAADGSLTGYAYGIETKQMLLEMERRS
ncbi:MAG: methylated-DNA--[protein]-cysteine S-methyltransferase [Synergistaceae bacterium]|nr:methylated-DNA--[protein]-cysteine S-methyltransferase [Synergistaceae bacterium]